MDDNRIQTIDDIIDIHKTNDKSQLIRNTQSLTIILEALSKWNVESTSDTPILLANILCEVVKENTELIMPVLQLFYHTVNYLLTNNPSPSSSPPSSPPREGAPPKDIINTAIFTLFGNICFLFSTNQQLLSQSIPYVLEMGKKSNHIQSIVFSSLVSEALNQAQVLAPFVTQLIDYSLIYPNYFMLLGGLYSYNQNDFEPRGEELVRCFEQQPESRASLLNIFGNMSKYNAAAVVSYLPRLKTALLQKSMSSIASIILKNVAMKYPFVLASLMGDVYESITQGYSLPIDVIGMCPPSRTQEALEFLIALLQKEEGNVSVTVSILKAMKVLQQTSPGLFTSTAPFIKYTDGSLSNNIEFISNLAQEIIDNIKQYGDRKQLVNPIPSISNNTSDIENRIGSCLIQLESVEGGEEDKYLLKEHYTLVLDILQLIPIVRQCTIKKDTQEKNKSMSLVFLFGNDSVELVLEKSNDQLVWIKIDHLLSIVNLNTFIVHQDRDPQLLQSIKKQPFINLEEIKEIHKQLTGLLEYTPLSPKCIASPIGPSVSVSTMGGDHPLTMSIPSITINDFNNSLQSSQDQNNNSSITSNTTIVNSTSNHSNLLSPSSSSTIPTNQIVHQGTLYKKSKYLRRFELFWFELYPNMLIGLHKKEKDRKNKDELVSSTSANSVPSSGHEDLLVKINIRDIQEIRVVDSSGGSSGGGGFIRRKSKKEKEDHDESSKSNESKSFYIITPKRKYLIKANNPAEQSVWLTKIKEMFQLLNQGADGQPNNLSIPTTTTTPVSPELESTAPPQTSTSLPTSPLGSAPTSPQLQSTSPNKKKFMRRITQYFPKMNKI